MNRVLAVFILIVIMVHSESVYGLEYKTKEVEYESIEKEIAKSLTDAEECFKIKIQGFTEANKREKGDEILKKIMQEVNKAMGNMRTVDVLNIKRTEIMTKCHIDGEHKVIEEVKIRVYYKNSKEDYKILDRWIDSILEGTEDKSVECRLKKAYDEILDTIEYNKVIVNGVDKSNRNVVKAISGYGAVCEVYAVMVARVCDKLGIKNDIIIGVNGNEKHSWNVVYINEEWVYIDATWGDTDKSKCSDEYFLVSGEELINVGHKWSASKYKKYE